MRYTFTSCLLAAGFLFMLVFPILGLMSGMMEPEAWEGSAIFGAILFASGAIRDAIERRQP